MTRAVRRYTKGGITLPMRNPGQDLLCWRWQPSGCDLPPADPVSFLECYRNTNIGFVGDSLNRNMSLPLVCMLKSASSDVRKWRLAGADKGLTFVRYNLTLAYHRTYLLVRYGSWSATSNGGALESLGYKQGYKIDVDVPDPKWAKAPKFHHILVLIPDTGGGLRQNLTRYSLQCSSFKMAFL